MALDFPASPGVGQSFTAGGVTWTWDGSKWVYQGAAGSGFYLPLSGGTISGGLTVQGSTSLQALTCTSINGGPAVFPAMRNRVINGSMRIDQRHSGAAFNAVPTGAYIIDRWAYAGSVAGKFNAGQNLGAVAAPAGFVNYLGAQTAVNYTVAATDAFQLYQGIEGLNLADLGWGKAGAQAVTLSFWARSSVTGTHSGSLQNNATNRNYPFSFSLPAANTWTQISLTIPGDTAGTWTTDNSAGAWLNFCLGAGASQRAAAGAWNALANIIGVTGGVNVVATLNATFQITGVQLEPGSAATPYEWRHIGLDLALCQRYYQQYICVAAGSGIQIYFAAAAASAPGLYSMIFPPMRSGPTASLVGTWTLSNCVAPTFQSNSNGVMLIYTTASAAGTVQAYPPANGGFALSAEL